MYLVELRPGKEELYRSVDELAAAIRRGDVDMHSRIFHRATSKWISITLHPQFRAIAAQDIVEAPPPEPKEWTFLTSAADELERAPPRPIDLGSAMESEPPAASTDPASDPSTARWRRPFTLGIAGLLVVIGTQVAVSMPRPEWPRIGIDKVLRAAPAQPADNGGDNQASTVVSLASTAGMEPIDYASPAADVQLARVPVYVPPAPALRLNDLDTAPLPDATEEAVSVETMIRRYDAAYNEARERLASGLRVAQLSQLFAPASLASAGGVAELRMNVAGVVNFVRAYQAREVEIEQSHQDTFAVLSRQLAWPAKDIRRWYARPSHKEPRAAATVTMPLLASADSLLAVLANNVGGYRVMGTSIAFNQPEATAEYRRLRQVLEGYLVSAAASAAGDSRSDGVLAALAEAIGATRLPVETAS